MKNPKVVISSIAALICMVLTFTTNWMFLILAAILSWWGWRQLSRQNKKEKPKYQARYKKTRK